MLENIRIVLVGTTDQRNIGSAARAMKTMGLSRLVLVEPKDPPQGAAQALAAGATDILANAQTVGSLAEALTGCSLVLATSARNRTLDWPQLDPRQAGEKIVREGFANTENPAQIAIVFGREANGLTNEELQQSNVHIHIPANPDYSSLNLAMAVQTVCYEVRMAWLAAQQEPPTAEAEYPLHQDLESFYVHLEQVLTKSGFIVRQHPGLVMTKLRRMFTRTRPEANELNILRGILASVEKFIPTEDNSKSKG